MVVTSVRRYNFFKHDAIVQLFNRIFAGTYHCFEYHFAGHRFSSCHRGHQNLNIKASLPVIRLLYVLYYCQCNSDDFSESAVLSSKCLRPLCYSSWIQNFILLENVSLKALQTAQNHGWRQATAISSCRSLKILWTHYYQR